MWHRKPRAYQGAQGETMSLHDFVPQVSEGLRKQYVISNDPFVEFQNFFLTEMGKSEKDWAVAFTLDKGRVSMYLKDSGLEFKTSSVKKATDWLTSNGI
jgi:hypothetical protein